MSEHLLSAETRAQILPEALSDHDYVSLKIGPTPLRKGPGIWRFDNSLLSIEDFAQRIVETVETIKETGTPSDPGSEWEWPQSKNGPGHYRLHQQDSY